MTNSVPMTKAAREAYRYLTAFRATKIAGRLIARFLDDLDEKDKIIAELEDRITLVCKANRSLSLPRISDG